MGHAAAVPRLAGASLVMALVAACGTVRGPGASPSPTASSPYAAAVAPLLASLDAGIFLPDALPPGLVVAASLVAAPSRGREAAVLGEPTLVLSFTAIPNGKPVLTLWEGRAECCPDFSRRSPSPVTVRRAASGDLQGEVLAPLSAAEGATLRWREPPGTDIVLVGSPFGDFRDAEALLALARSMRPVPRPAGGEVLLAYWSTHVSHSATGHRVFVAVRSAPLPASARIVDPNGAVVATAAFEPPKPYECLAAAAGVAALAVPREVVDAFRPDPAASAAYRVEVRVGDAWRPVQLVSGGCFSIE